MRHTSPLAAAVVVVVAIGAPPSNRTGQCTRGILLNDVTYIPPTPHAKSPKHLIRNSHGQCRSGASASQHVVLGWEDDPADWNCTKLEVHSSVVSHQASVMPPLR